MTGIRLSVVVRVADTSNVTPTITALDVQKAPDDQWQLVLVATSDDANRRATAYQEFRPNVVAVAAGEDLAQSVTGSWVWEVAAGDVPLPTAVGRITEAIDTGAGLPIVGRTVSRGRRENDWLFDGSSRLTGSAALAALCEPAVILPRAQWPGAEGAGDDYPRFATAVAALARLESVEVLTGSAVLVGGGPEAEVSDEARLRSLVAALAGVDPALAADTVRAEFARQSWKIDQTSEADASALAARVTEPALPVRLVAEGRFDDARTLHRATSEIAWTVHSVEAEWHEGALRISGSATLQVPQSVVDLYAGGHADRLGAPRPRIGLRNRHTTGVVPLRTTVEVEAGPAGWTTSFLAQVDVAGWAESLQPAAYQVVLEAPGLPGNPLLPLRRDGLHLPAVLGDRLATVRHEAKAGLHLDLGATRQSLLRDLDPTGSRIQESMSGSALTIPAPPVHVWPPERLADPLRGQLVLGGLPFPAVLDLDLDPPTVHCLVSGMPGSVAIQTRFGPGKATQTGCELRVSPDGQYSVGPLSTAETSGVSTLVASGMIPKKGGGKPKAATGSAKSSAAPQPGLLRVAWRRLPSPVQDRLRGPAKRLIGN